MSHLLDDDEDLMQRRERELTLSTGAILGIFFGLVLVCGLFFAFGYNLGQKSKSQGPATADDATASSANVLTGQNKPSAGSFESSPSPQPATTSAPLVNPPPPQATTSHVQTLPSAQPLQSVPVDAPQPVRAPATIPPPSYASSEMPDTFIVQIAALSNPGDASMLVSALRGKGYSVAAINVPTDHLIHVQVGPFDSKPQATAMRARLLADGFNAIVK